MSRFDISDLKATVHQTRDACQKDHVVTEKDLLLDFAALFFVFLVNFT